jgi:Trypsin
MNEALRRRNPAGTTLILFAQLCSPLASTTALSDDDAITLDMYQVREFGAGLPQIEHGDKQTPANWPATLKYCSPPNAQKCHFYDQPPTISCTATIIGEKVVITAAHCLAKPTQDALIHFNTGDVRIRCARHSEFNANGLAHDIALCTSDQVLPHVDAEGHSFLYENLYNGDSWDQTKSTVFLLGYGCRDLTDITKDYGQLYGGIATFDKNPDPNDPDHKYSFRVNGGAVVCEGDSGGAAYLLINDTHLTGARSVVGINSANYGPGDQQSLIAKVSGSDFQFIRNEADKKQAKICGVDHDAKNCRNSFTE